MNFSTFKGLSYEPQDAESEIMLSELPLSIIMGSIESQFNDPLDYRKNDFVQSFITKYIITKENLMESDDEDIDEQKEELSKLYDKFISFMENIFHEKLGIGLPEIDDQSEDDQLELIHYIYRFFIINMKKNFSTYIYNYIKENKDELSEDLPKRKDVTTSSLKQAISDPRDLAIITNIPDVIEAVLGDEDVNVDKFLELSRGNDANLENDFISDHYEDFTITGNFVSPYCQMLTDEFRIEIECKVRNKILKKYRKK